MKPTDCAFPSFVSFTGPARVGDLTIPAGTTQVYVQEGLTAREHAAIALRVPDSGNDWLDAMIRTAQCNDLAKAAMQGFCANFAVFAPNSQHGWGLVNCNAHELAAECELLADAMLSASAAHSAEGE